ncbi:flagellar basal-body rod protein FlgF [Calditerrivibrio nitroreducens]|uniref:Flagellar basal-body rod protein FlgF n=1 Tax=Calditerrivibrio nitroreducens (strain DSM 19672 / NBRC 101217 / Yu37-1) TaxID=768670 RepID=E4TEV3_CALNY|nr:flagellar basal-body rod protein FlgF [Calditerrivibrio nitroreducens]ADR18359.1 flagellar basal-body rod protein FlgF [Calditerrivibrio nitroreducens DSM 19672]
MLNGLYVAASGMMMQERVVSNIANNLANVNTNGYKKDGFTFQNYIAKPKEFPEDIIRSSLYNQTINRTVKLDRNYLDLSEGAVHQTGNKFDLAIGDKNGFFVVDTPWGIRFTRDGAFSINSDNELVNGSGYRVLSRNNQPIVINGNDVVFLPTGEVMVNGVQVDQLNIATFEDNTRLQKVGRNLFAAVDILPVEMENPNIMQGYIEGSNVNAVEEMVKMIEANRGFETYQKVIQTIDQLNEKASNELGRIA